MRKIRLFLVACAAMAGLSQAQAVTVEKPGSYLTFQAFNPGDTVFLYNVKAEMFYMNGNAYSTQTSLSTSSAILTTFVQTEDEETTYFIWDRAAIKSGWTKCFVANLTIPGASYVDEASQGNDHWRVIDQGNNTYRIQSTAVSADEVGQTFFGWDGGDNTIVYPLLSVDDDAAANYGLDWKIVKGDSAQLKLFVARAALYEQMVKADEAGVSYDYSAVYKGTDADAINAAADELATTIVNKKLEDASDDNPVDVSELIKNADCAAMDGWTFEQTGSGTWQVQGASYDNGEVFLKNFIESWGGSNSTVLGDRKMYQTITGLPAGSYELGCDAIASYQADASVTPTGGYLYGNSYQTTMATANGVPEHFTVGIVLSEGESLEIGAKVESCNFNWFAVDNFTLTYYGKGTMALRNSLQNAIDNASQYDGVQAYEEYLNALADAIEKGNSVLDNESASPSDLTEALQAINEATKLIQTNIELYAELAEELNNANGIVNDYDRDQYTEVGTLESYINSCPDADDNDLNDVVASTMVGNEAVETIIETLKKLEKKALYSGIRPGADITDILADPGFDNGGKGSGFAWEGLRTPNSATSNCEAYETTFDMYQQLTDLPNGVYTLRVQAFQRTGWAGDVYEKYIAGDTATNTYIYANENAQQVANIMRDREATAHYTAETDLSEFEWYDSSKSGWDGNYDSSLNDGTYCPNGMTGSRIWFELTKPNGELYYDNVISALVTDGSMRFGIRCTEKSTAYWTIFDNVRLFYEGNDAETLQSAVAELAAQVEAIKNDPMCADSLNAMTAALTACQNNKEGGDELIAQMLTLQKAIAAARNSITAYKPLVYALKFFNEKIEENPRESGDKSEIEAVEAKMNAGAYQDAEIDGVVNGLIQPYQAYIMSDIKANPTSYSEENPADITAAILNSDFADNTTDFWDFFYPTDSLGNAIDSYTTGGGVSYNTMEVYNARFNFFQTIYNAPKGYYRLSVVGFFRDGFPASLSEKLTNETMVDSAFMYIGGFEEPLARCTDGALADTTGIGGEYGAVTYDYEGATYYIPNNMQAASVWMQYAPTAGLYTKFVDAMAGEDSNTFNVGVKCDYLNSGQWAIFKDFKLEYLGQTAPDGIEGVNNSNATVQSQQIFNASGAQMGRLNKGVNIVKQQMSDGTTRVKKVIVK